MWRNLRPQLPSPGLSPPECTRTEKDLHLLQLGCGDSLRKGRPQEGGDRAEPLEEQPGDRRQRGTGGSWKARQLRQGQCWLQPLT